jgi:hypothetical protein
VQQQLPFARPHPRLSRQQYSQLVSQCEPPFVLQTRRGRPPSPHFVQFLALHVELHPPQSRSHVPHVGPRSMHVLPRSPLDPPH